MSLEGCWRFETPSDWSDEAKSRMGVLKGDLCWAANLGWFMDLVQDLQNAETSPRRLSFAAPNSVAADYQSRVVEHRNLTFIPFRVRPTGEIQYGRKCNRSGDGTYKRSYRFRWRPTEWKITARGLCRVGHQPVGEFRRAFPEHVVGWIQSLHADQRKTLNEHGKIMHACSLCGKPLARGHGIGTECTQLVETSSSTPTQ